MRIFLTLYAVANVDEFNTLFLIVPSTTFGTVNISCRSVAVFSSLVFSTKMLSILFLSNPGGRKAWIVFISYLQCRA